MGFASESETETSMVNEKGMLLASETVTRWGISSAMMLETEMATA